MNDQQLCEIVHAATASAMYPRGTHSGETMAVAKAVRAAVAEECAALLERRRDNMTTEGCSGETTYYIEAQQEQLTDSANALRAHF